MPEKTGYAQGEPSWVDLSTDDVPAAKTFYSTLFGWVADDVPMEDAGGYGMFTLGGSYVGGYAPRNDERPSAWSVYVAVDDVEDVLARVQKAGGTVVDGPNDVFTSGRMAVVRDPAGAYLSLWQAMSHTGAGVQDEPNTLTWVELSTTDMDLAWTFYENVFGWTAKASDTGDTTYVEFTMGGRSVAGMMAQDPSQAGMPAYWMPYFQPADLDKTVGEATALGATLVVPRTSIPGGDFAVLTDPQGAAFGLFKPEAATPPD
jgi:hypothetical protein